MLLQEFEAGQEKPYLGIDLKGRTVPSFEDIKGGGKNGDGFLFGGGLR
jgi:hypothetical protein